MNWYSQGKSSLVSFPKYPVFSKIFLKMREFITRNLCSFPQKSELQSYRESLCRNSNIKWFYNPDPCTCLPLFFFTVSYWKYWSLTSTCQLICFYHDKIFKAYLLYYSGILIPNLSLDLSLQYFYFFMPHVTRLLFGQGSTTDNYHGAATTASKWMPKPKSQCTPLETLFGSCVANFWLLLTLIENRV